MRSLQRVSLPLRVCKENRYRICTAVALICLAVISCRVSPLGIDHTATAQKHAATELPSLGRSRQIESGIVRYEVKIPKGDKASTIWIYLPEPLPAKKIPCVVIAPAGSRLFHGMNLAKGDIAEHLPYVRAGFAVVAYELDGNLGDELTSSEVFAAAQAFHDADAGLANARTALDFIKARVPSVDTNKIYTAGHSSAGTMALLLAEHDTRIKACAAFAPACDLEKRLGSEVISIFSSRIPDYSAFVRRSSPSVGIQALHCPVFLFHADDDTNVPTKEVALFAAQLQKTNDHVKFARVPTGDHYDSMIKAGIPQAIQWFKQLQSK